MPNQFATGRWAIAQCDRCNFRFKLKQLKSLVIKTKNVNILVCPECWEPDQPQLQLGMYPVYDPQAIRNPRVDSNSYYQSGVNGLRIEPVNNDSSQDENGVPLGGSRVIQWGWYPVGGARWFDTGLTPNDLIGVGAVNSVTVSQEFMMDKADLKQDKKMIAGAVHKHEKKLHPGKPMTKLKKGGPTGMDMRKMGRNLARAANQRGR